MVFALRRERRKAQAYQKRRRLTATVGRKLPAEDWRLAPTPGKMALLAGERDGQPSPPKA
jgi:hypothetical protein